MTRIKVADVVKVSTTPQFDGQGLVLRIEDARGSVVEVELVSLMTAPGLRDKGAKFSGAAVDFSEGLPA